MLLPKFESELEEKEPGDNFEFTLTPEEGYGAYEPKYKTDIPKSAFEIDGKVREDLLVPGNIIPMLNSAGQVIQGKVESVGEDSVTMDFNHPMAGKTLNFEVEVVSVRDVTPEDLQSAGGCSCGCDGGCGDHEGGCSDHKGGCGEGCCH